MRPTPLLLVALAGCSVLGAVNAQTTTRADFKASSGTLRDLAIMRKASQGGARIVTPRERLPADRGKGLAATPNLLYCVWVEKTTTGHDVLFRRSTTGGFSWETTRTIYTQPGTANWDFEQLDVGATNHEVYVAMSTAGPNAAWPDKIYLIASNDQGQTWTKPLHVSVTAQAAGRDADRLRVASAFGRTHIAFQFADSTNSVNELYYARAQFQNGQLVVSKDVRVSTHQAKAFTDAVRHFDIDAAGSLVSIAYTSPNLTTDYGNLYVVSDVSFGSGFATAKPLKITSYTAAAPRTDPYWEPMVKCTVSNVYVVFLDNARWPNSVYFTASYDFGRTFAKPVELNPAANSFDADLPVLAARGSTVCVAWHDDRAGNSNLGNVAYLLVDNNSGRDLLAKKFREVRIDPQTSPPMRTEYPQVAMRDDRIAVVYEKSTFDNQTAQAEDTFLIESLDAGKTWSKPRALTRIGTVFNGTKDVDNPQVVMTQNHDAVAYWADNRTTQSLYVAGVKLPELAKLGSGRGFEVRAGPSHAGDVAIMLLTEKGTAPPLALDNRGNQLNIALGAATLATLGLPILVKTCDAAGKAAFAGLPDGPFGLHAAVVGIKNFQVDWFTDPVKY